MRLVAVALAVVAILALGTLGTHFVYAAPWLLSGYWTLALMTTVGDARLSPHTPVQIVYTGLMTVVGTALWIYWLSIILAAILAFDQRRRERRVMDELKRLTDHFVVLGAGRVGQSIADELTAHGARVIMGDTDAARIEGLPAHDYLTLAVPAYDLEHLSHIRMDAARGLALAMPDDAQNLFAYLTARDMNPNLHVVARAQTEDSARHLRQLGVNQVVLPDLAGGRRMGRMLTKPRAHELMSVLTNEEGVALHEVELGSHHPLVGQAVRQVRQTFGPNYTLIGYWRQDLARLAPAADEQLASGDVLILLELLPAAAGSAPASRPRVTVSAEPPG